MSDLTNQTLGKYEVIREVGRGSMGIVYLAHDPFAGRDVALKVALPESLQDETSGVRYRKLFFNEAHAAGVLDHPANGIVWLARRYAEQGLTLEAGQTILAGSFTRPIDIRAGDEFRFDYGDLGQFGLDFT